MDKHLNDIVSLLLMMSIGQAFLIIFLAWSVYKMRVASRFYLSLKMLSLTMINLTDLFFLNHSIDYLPIILIAAQFLFLLGPSVYLFYKYTFSEISQFQWSDLKHYIVFVFFLSIILLQLVLLDIEVLKKDVFTTENELDVFDIVIVFYTMLYLFNAYLQFKRYAFNPTNIFKLKGYQYYKTYLLLLTIGVLVWFLSVLMLNKTIEYFLIILTQIIIFYFSWLCIKTNFLFMREEEFVDNKLNFVTVNDTTIKYGRNKLESEEIQQLRTQIMEAIQEKVYLKPNLTLADFAEIIDTSVHSLSQVINNSFNSNFNDFVNFYRIEEFKKELIKAENRQLSIFGIAQNCGFNSKATFYSVFKKMTGLTPKEYLQTHSIIQSIDN